MDSPIFSICVPVYKNTHFLERLLESTLKQTFQDYELVITDDSPDDSVKDFLVKKYLDKRIRYYKNHKSLGTPENWNEGIRRAQGQWIKLMHDDDWFASAHALQCFYEATQSEKADFYFSGYNNVFLDDNDRVEEVVFPNRRWLRVKKYAPNLYTRNVIGAPSVVLVKNTLGELYDNRMKWLVDIDYYIRIMQKGKIVHIPEPLVNLGRSNLQVTSYTQNMPAVEIPEGLLLQSKLGYTSFHHILFFDAWWRLVRNLGIRKIDEFGKYASPQQVPKSIWLIISVQKVFPTGLLRIGPFSKILMTLSWCYNRFKVRD